MDLDGKGFATRCVHGFGGPDPATGAVVPPISLATTFAQDGVGGLVAGYEYSRSANPTRAALEAHVAALEGGGHGLAFASGLAAEDALLRLLAPGDAVLIPDDAYGGTFRLAARVHATSGVDVDAVDLTDLDAVAAAWRPGTRMVWIETPTNPMLRIVDVEAVAALAHERGAHRRRRQHLRHPGPPAAARPRRRRRRALVDQVPRRPQRRRRRAPWSSTTTSSPSASAFLQNAAGAVPGPFDCYLVIRGLRTLDLRMRRHCESAAVVADALAAHPAVAEVLWPGLPDHPGHDVAARQMQGFGGMVSFRAAGGEAAALAVCGHTEVFTLAESLGAVESLIEHPARMTHASVAGTTNAVPDDLVRLSIGIEDPADLVADLTAALERAGA